MANRTQVVTPEREAFLAGERPADVHIFLHEDRVANVEALEPHGERVDAGVVLLLDGAKGREVFADATGIDPMALAREAMGTEGSVDRDCTGGTCPSCGAEDPEFVFAFAEEQNEEAGGLYAEGPVIHAYVACGCGERYSEKWVAGEQSA